MLNIQLLRKVQESIMDPTHSFNMRDWCDCIAGHIVRVATGEMIPYTVGTRSVTAEITRAAGIAGISNYEEAYNLFMSYPYAEFDRKAAVRAIDELIEREEEQAAEQGLRGKAHSRSPRANTQASIPGTVRVIDWIPTVVVPPLAILRMQERQAIDDILAEAKHEEDLVAV